MLRQEADRYINEKEGLDRLGGKAEIYHRLLAGFVEKNMLANVEETLAAGDTAGAAGAAHALKGTAANLSMGALYQASFAAETRLKEGENATGEMERLRLVYGKTVEAVAALVGG